MRRLAKDQAAVRLSTPPNYLFPHGDDADLPDDLTQLIILITGAHGTPYSQGMWKLHLRMPHDYPQNPPKATFKTRIYHPNVEENTGAVCLDTLKKDWQPKLTLKDILVTISCLLIHPNPDSALNSDAGALLQEDYDAFAKKARLMTSIHASIPKALSDAVVAAKRRGEDDNVLEQIEGEPRPVASRAASSSTSVVMKGRPDGNLSVSSSYQAPLESEDEDQEDNTKENDPLHSPTSSARPPPSPRKVLGKRALSDIPLLADPDQANLEPTSQHGKPAAEMNTNETSTETSSEPLKKSPKLARSAEDLIPEDILDHGDTARVVSNAAPLPTSTADDKENASVALRTRNIEIRNTTAAPQKTDSAARPTLRKVSNVGSSRGKNLPRVGIRRL